MSSVLDYVGMLDRLDVTGVDPMGMGMNRFAQLRDDAIGESFEYSDLESLGGGSFDTSRQSFVVQPVFGEL